MDDNKSGLYIVAIVGVIAVVALVVLTLGAGRERAVYTGTSGDATGQAIGRELSYAPTEGMVCDCTYANARTGEVIFTESDDSGSGHCMSKSNAELVGQNCYYGSAS